MKELDQIRAPLYRELEKLSKETAYQAGKDSHLCCTRKYNQMRISPLEARSSLSHFGKTPSFAEDYQQFSTVLKSPSRVFPITARGRLLTAPSWRRESAWSTT